MDGLISAFGLDVKIFAAEVVNFLILLAIIFWVIKKYVNPILEKRREVIEQGVAKFEEAEATLASAEEEKNTILADAQNQASATISESVEKAKQRESDILGDAEQQASELLAKAQERGEKQKEAIIQSSKDDIAKMIVLGVEKVLKTK